MTDHRNTPGDAEMTGALRDLSVAPSAESYWTALEARILAHIAVARDGQRWWSTFGELGRPALAAAAILIFVASAAVMHTRQLEARNAYASVISSAAPPSIEASARSTASGDGDAAINYILSH